jgi:hypothetical protein
LLRFRDLIADRFSPFDRRDFLRFATMCSTS